MGNPCIEWAGYRNRQGYGRIKSGPMKDRLAHRVALEASLGRPILPGLVAMHLCDNPACVNPEHLREATVAENNVDRDRKGRHAESRKPCCPRCGGSYTMDRRGWRYCATCKVENERRRLARLATS